MILLVIILLVPYTRTVPYMILLLYVTVQVNLIRMVVQWSSNINYAHSKSGAQSAQNSSQTRLESWRRRTKNEKKQETNDPTRASVILIRLDCFHYFTYCTIHTRYTDPSKHSDCIGSGDYYIK